MLQWPHDPDIAQAVSVVSKFNANPNAAHLTAVKENSTVLEGYSESCS